MCVVATIMVCRRSGPFMFVSCVASTPVSLRLGLHTQGSVSEWDRRRGDVGRVSASLFILGDSPISDEGRSGARPLWFSAKSRP